MGTNNNKAPAKIKKPISSKQSTLTVSNSHSSLQSDDLAKALVVQASTSKGSVVAAHVEVFPSSLSASSNKNDAVVVVDGAALCEVPVLPFAGLSNVADNNASLMPIVGVGADIDVSVASIVNGSTKGKGTIPRTEKAMFGTAAVVDGELTLQTVPRLRFLHLSRLDSSVTEDNVMDYASLKLNVPKSLLHCKKLIKKDVDTTSLRFVNFKLGLPADFFDLALDPIIWPVHVQIKQFVNFPKKDLNFKMI